MNLKWIAAAVFLLPLGCGKAMTPKQKIAMLEGQRLEIIADLHRQQAECQAQAIEFANSPMRDSVVSSCVETYRVMHAASMRIMADFDKRIAEIEQQNKPKDLDLTYDPNWKPPSGLVPFNGKLDNEK